MKPVKKINEKEIPIAESPDSRYVCFNDIVGKGAYKIVYRAYDRQKGIDVAWNSIDIGSLDNNEQQLVIDEVMMLKELSPQCKYIIDFQNAWQDNDKVIFITELALSGTLKQYILQRKDNINLRVIKIWCKQILEGLKFLHDQHIAHRDIKCNNIMYNCNTGTIMIGDFGLAKQRVSNFRTVIGTPEYMAPEMYEDTGYDEKVDIYAFGMSMLEMITKEVPYKECGGVGHLYKNVSQGIKPECIKNVKNESAREIILKCVRCNPADRPTATELLQDPFFIFVTNEDDDRNLIKMDLCGVVSADVIEPIEAIDVNVGLPASTSSDTVSEDMKDTSTIIEEIQQKKGNNIQDLLLFNLEQFSRLSDDAM